MHDARGPCPSLARDGSRSRKSREIAFEFDHVVMSAAALGAVAALSFAMKMPPAIIELHRNSREMALTTCTRDL